MALEIPLRELFSRLICKQLLLLLSWLLLFLEFLWFLDFVFGFLEVLLFFCLVFGWFSFSWLWLLAPLLALREARLEELVEHRLDFLRVLNSDSVSSESDFGCFSEGTFIRTISFPSSFLF